MTEPFAGWLGPIAQTIFVPAIAAVLAAAAVRLALGRPGAALAAGLGLGAGELAIAWAIGGAPNVLSPAGVDKLVLVTLLFAPAAAAMIRFGKLEARAVFAIAAFAPVLWIAWPVLINPDFDVLWRTALAVLVAGAASVGLGRTERAALPTVIPMAAIGLAGIAYYGATYRMSQLLGGLTIGSIAAPGVVLLLGGIGAAGGIARIMLGTPYRAAVVAGLSAGVAILVLYTVSPWFALVLLIPVFFASDLARALPRGPAMGQTRHLLISTGVALLSIAAAIGWAMRHGPEPYLG